MTGAQEGYWLTASSNGNLMPALHTRWIGLTKSIPVQYLEEHGIRPILNYAAEDDVTEEPQADAFCPHAAAERSLDRNMAIFKRSIADSDNTRNRAFVAIKVSDNCDISTSQVHCSQNMVTEQYAGSRKAPILGSPTI
jgi:hypothetical protein